MNVWFTSDLHFGHENIIKYSGRPFNNADQMNQIMIDNWNSVVDTNDTVFVVGDFALGKHQHTVPLVAELNGNVVLISGNHDGTFQKRSKAEKMKRFYIASGFNDVIDGMKYTLPSGVTVLVDHFPYKGDNKEHDRYPEVRPRDTGGWLVHGHVHELWTVKGRQINVGVDVWDFFPVHETEIDAIVSNV